MSGGLYRDGQTLARHNQQLIAKRTGWPDGALETCWDLEDRHPHWSVDWVPENTVKGFERPTGFRATHPRMGHDVGKIEAFARTAEELEPLLAEVPEHDYSIRGCSWCVAYLGAQARVWS